MTNKISFTKIMYLFILLNFLIFSVSLIKSRVALSNVPVAKDYDFWSSVLDAVLWLAPNQVYFLFSKSSIGATIALALVASAALLFLANAAVKTGKTYLIYGIVPAYFLFGVASLFLSMMFLV